MDKLPTVAQLQEQIKGMKLFSILLTKEQKSTLHNLESTLENMYKQSNLFIEYFSDHGWCLYDSMNFAVIENANREFEKNGLEAAEAVLEKYFLNDVKDTIRWLTASSNELFIRQHLIEEAFANHFSEKFLSSVPLFLLIIDGAINDYTSDAGFWSEKTDISAWDCLVGSSESLTKMKDIFNRSRKKTSTEQIDVPYRNGILHGRDLGFGNSKVSCKCVALLFGVYDYIKMKRSEQERKEKYDLTNTPPPFHEIIEKYKENMRINSEIKQWERRNVKIGTDIPPTGCKEDYRDYEYIHPIIDMMEYWKRKDYGHLAQVLRIMIGEQYAPSARAGYCRELFSNRVLVDWKICEIEERAVALVGITVTVNWVQNEKEFEAKLVFGSCYKTIDEKSIALPWRNNGEWTLYPWNVAALYKDS